MSKRELAEKIGDRLSVLDCRPTSGQLDQLASYCELLARWNRKINLTALPLEGFPLDTLDVLIVEPLALVGLMRSGSYEWLDFGSGGGSPAIPIKIMAPDVRLALIEARSRKSAFLQEVIRSLELKGARVSTTRIEELGQGETAQLVTLRAVRTSPEIREAAHRVLQPGGCLAVFSTADEPNLEGFSLERSVSLPSRGHVLHLLTKAL